MSQAVVSPTTQSSHSAPLSVTLITAEAVAMNRLARETARLVERLEILGMATGDGLRPAVEGAAEALIRFLDYLDGDSDLEPEEDDEHDGREPDEDFEDADDNGIADAGGLAEQWSGVRQVTTGVE